MKTLFKNGTIVDGTGSAPHKGDVLIEDDRILAESKDYLPTAYGFR